MVSARGFTIVELILVIGIIGILTGGVISAINVPLQLQKARDGQRKTDLLKIQSALELYRTDQGSYPSSIASGTPIQSPDGQSVYMKSVPWDPKDPIVRYQYCFYNNNSKYALRACLENTSDSGKDATTDFAITGCTFNISATLCSSASVVSYTVQNP